MKSETIETFLENIPEEFRKEITCNHKDYGKIRFDPDSSPDAWIHYKKYYIEGEKPLDYDFNTLHFLSYRNERNKIWYEDKPNTYGTNRLYAVQKARSNWSENDITCFGSGLALGGDCDFNFNEKKCSLFKAIIDEDSKLCEMLECCTKMHHTVLNFSLMQKTGNMQGHKGSNRFDRFDTFISDLNEYLNGLSNRVLDKATGANTNDLVHYLNSFKNIYDYMEKMYFIFDADFVNRIIDEGKKPLLNKYDIERYMRLAMDYWTIKAKYFGDQQ
ncbi:hypothetical protein [Butyrivibrio sp. NC2007]|uniref:hypothetical protein n=1 Tax=Butyrivibrio sp. NC2007 TaxID=1280683 RepID=UPI0003B78B7D|nr:hypothetical protein [Butyrivibrio sp. NC2007]